MIPVLQDHLLYIILLLSPVVTSRSAWKPDLAERQALQQLKYRRHAGISNCVIALPSGRVCEERERGRERGTERRGLTS